MMTEQELQQRLDRQDAVLDAIYGSVEKTRRYFLWTMILSAAVIVLPLIGLMVTLPSALRTLTDAPALQILNDLNTAL